LKSLLAAVSALKQACTYTNIQKAFERSGIYPRDINAALRNPRLNQSLLIEETPLLIDNTSTRKKLSITSQLITKDSVIDAIKARDEEKKRKFDEKNQYKISNPFLEKRRQRNRRSQRRNQPSLHS
jgi:DNA-binding GntR family transcriptional regulator